MHPDAHFDPRFHKALQRRVRLAAPPLRRAWGRLLFAAALGLLMLAVAVVYLGMLGFTAVTAPPIPAAFGLVLAAASAGSGSERSNRSVFLRVMAEHPAEPRHVIHRLRGMEGATLISFPALALISAAIYLIASRSGAETWLPVLSAALAAGLMTSGAYALLKFLAGGRMVRVAALAVGIGTFVALKMKDASADTVTVLNPIVWPLLALQNPGDTAALLRATTGCAGSVLILIAAWVNLPRYAGRYVRMLDPREEEVDAATPRRMFTLRLPAIFSDGKTMAGPGFWERIIARTRTPQQRALAELALAPDAPSLATLFLRCLLRLGIALAAIVALGFWSPDTALLLGGIAGVGIIGKTLFSTPAADGFPFHPLLRGRELPAGQQVVPLALLPVPWSAVSSMFLKSLWPRCVLVGCLFLPLGALGDFLLHRSSPGLPMTTGALLTTVFAGTYALLAFTHDLTGQSGDWRSPGCRGAWRWLSLLALQLPAFFASIAAIPLGIVCWAKPHLAPWAAGSLALSLLAAAGAHLLLLRLLQRGDLDLWKIPPPPRRVLT